MSRARRCRARRRRRVVPVLVVGCRPRRVDASHRRVRRHRDERRPPGQHLGHVLRPHGRVHLRDRLVPGQCDRHGARRRRRHESREQHCDGRRPADAQGVGRDRAERPAPGQRRCRGTATFKFVVSNTGPSDAIGVPVADALPPGATGASWSADDFGTGAAYTPSGAGPVDELVDLPVNALIVYTFVVDISPSATGTIENTATVGTSAGRARRQRVQPHADAVGSAHGGGRPPGDRRRRGLVRRRRHGRDVHPLGGERRSLGRAERHRERHMAGGRPRSGPRHTVSGSVHRRARLQLRPRHARRRCPRPR